MTENKRLVWGKLSILVCASTNENIHMFGDVSYETGDQHNSTI